MSFKEYLAGYTDTVVAHDEETPEAGDWLQLDADGEAVGYFYKTNPNAKWDWFQVGGRFGGGLLIKEDVVQKLFRLKVAIQKSEQISEEEAHWLSRFLVVSNEGEIVADEPLLCDSAPSDSVDFANMRLAYQNHELARYHEINAALGDNWQTYNQVAAANPDKDREAIVELYRGQPGIPELQKRLPLFTDIDEYNMSEAEFRSRMETWLPSFAALTDSGWLEPASMGWFGMTIDEVPHDEYAQDVKGFWENMPEDAQVTVVDCHI